MLRQQLFVCKLDVEFPRIEFTFEFACKIFYDRSETAHITRPIYSMMKIVGQLQYTFIGLRDRNSHNYNFLQARERSRKSGKRNITSVEHVARTSSLIYVTAI